jgi:nucleoside-diphosphate-sugar epimerase
MKILLTGATGFLGSHILLECINQGIQVVVLKRSYSDMHRIEECNGKYVSYDIDKFSLTDIFEQETNIDVIIHCATKYGRNNEKIIDILKCNISFPLQLLEIAIDNNIKAFINTDTSLGKLQLYKGYMQNYILTKKQFLEWGKMLSETKKIKFINMRLEHIYGEGDEDSKFTSFIIHNLLNNANSIDLTDGEQIRDFIYIKDVVSAYSTIISSIDNLNNYHEYEVGFGEKTKVKDFVITAKRIIQSNTLLNFGVLPYRENEILYSVADISKLQELGWNPRYNMQNGIEEYISKLK